MLCTRWMDGWMDGKEKGGRQLMGRVSGKSGKREEQ